MKLPPLSGRLLAFLALSAAVARWLTRTQKIYGWDSVHYILAQDRYDLLAHQPHPPGSYYYVLLARLVRTFTGDPHTALLIVSSLLGGALVIVLYHLARELWESEQAGWIAAVWGATSPLFWFYGSLGLNYGPSGTLSALVALGCVQACRPRSAPLGLVTMGAALGLLGGFRPTDVVFLLPACLWAFACAWRARTGGKALLTGPVLALGLTLGWLLPNLVNTGGLGGYLATLRGQEHLLSRSSAFLAGWPALLDAVYTHQRSLESLFAAGWLPLWVAPLVLGVTALRHRLRPRPDLPTGSHPSSYRAWWPLGLLAVLLAAPAFAFYLLGHFNSPGYALTYSAFLLAGAAGILGNAVGTVPSHFSRAGMALLLAGLAVGNTLLFLYGWPGAARLGQRSLSAVELRDHDRYYRALERYLEAHYPPGQVRILSSWNSTDGLRIIQALLPAHAADVAQAVDHLPELPPLFSGLSWLRLMTPDQIRSEGRPVLAIYRTREDPGYHESLFPRQWQKISIGSEYLIYRLRD